MYQYNKQTIGGIPTKKMKEDDLDKKAFRLGFGTAVLQAKQQKLLEEKDQMIAEVYSGLTNQLMAALSQGGGMPMGGSPQMPPNMMGGMGMPPAGAIPPPVGGPQNVPF